MSSPTTISRATSPSADRPRQALKGQGQWGLGYREPLNANEQAKRDSDGLEVRQRIIDVYSHTGFAGIDGGDLRNRMRWYGLYTQRAPGIPGGRTGALEPEQLEDEYFMMRVRIDGGRLTTAQLRAISDISTTYARGTADVTDRQNVQLHWVRIEDVPAIWDRLEAVGLSTTEACGDTPRVMLGCPLAGVAEDELIDATEALSETVRRYVGDPQFSNLPRKFKTSISGCTEHCTNHEINDVSFVGVVGPEGQAGFDVWVGGGLSTNPKLAQRLGVFVRPDQVPDVWAGIISVFRDYGYRRSRTHARIKFLIADWGVERFRTVLEKDYLDEPLPDGPPPAPPIRDQRDHVGPVRQRDGRYAVGFAPRAGRVSGGLLGTVADLAEQFGDGRIATTAQQKLIILGVEQSDVDGLTAALAEHDLQVNPSVFRRGTMACTGIEFCKLAIVETKARAEAMYRELERRLPDFDEPMSITVNGCPNSCARFQTADIGFKGSIVRDDAGNQVEGFQVHLGGHLGVDASFGRKFRGLRVTADGMTDYVERVLRTYTERRHLGERFAAYVARADESWLS